MNILNQMQSVPVSSNYNIQSNNNNNISYVQMESKDQISINTMSENMQPIKVYSNGGRILQGDINGQASTLKYLYTNDSEIEAEGDINGKKLVLSSDKPNHFSGTYNNKSFDFNITKNSSNDYVETIKGTFDGKPIDMELKGAKVPQDNDTKDLITSLLVVNYNAPFVINGKIANVVMSESATPIMEQKQTDKEKLIDKYIVPLVSIVVGAIIPCIPKIPGFIKDLITRNH